MIASALPRSPWERDDGSVDAARALRELGDALTITTVVDANGDRWVPAAVRDVGAHDPTHYDAVWVRDAVWCHWALDAAGDRDAADSVLRKLCRYFASAAQRERLRTLADNPSAAFGPDGAMHVPHIRFDGRSASMDDVQVDGRPQRWNHKQNDALALFFAAVMGALETGRWQWTAFSPEERESLALFPRYWARVAFATMEDSGAWEELERRNSSSIGLVTWALEEARRVLARVAPSDVDVPSLEAAIASGYGALERQLPFESPAYGKNDIRYREADAALLALLYPARLEKLAPGTFDAVLETVGTLVRPAGVLRYVGDAYQCAGYWANAEETEHEVRTDDCSRPEDFVRRSAGRPPDSEAEWFFDSWLALTWLRRFERTKSPSDRRRAEAHVARALRQRTGPNALGADGKLVPAGAFPESYNVVFRDGHRHYAPSPITPLNWAKASLALALRALVRAADGV